MVASVNPAAILKRGSDGLSLAQLREITDNPAKYQAVVDALDEARQKALAVKAAAEDVLARSEKARVDADAALAALAAAQKAAAEQNQKALEDIDRERSLFVEQQRVAREAAGEVSASLKDREANVFSREQRSAEREAELKEHEEAQLKADMALGDARAEVEVLRETLRATLFEVNRRLELIRSIWMRDITTAAEIADDDEPSGTGDGAL